jgi:uncharacterized protein YfdQ (DUF2303 family)
MDASAIKQIGDLAIKAEKAQRLETDTEAYLVDGKIVSLESLQEGRARFRGTYTTGSIADFAGYVSEHATDYSQGFVGVGPGLSSTVFINAGYVDDPGHCDWRAVLNPQPTAGFAAAMKVDGQKLDQKAAIEWLEDWNTFLTAQYGEEKRPLSAAIAAIRDIKITKSGESTHVENDNARKRTALEEVEASASGGIPSAIVMKVEPYEELRLRDIVIRIAVITSGPAPQISFRIAQREALTEAIAQDFKKTLQERIGETPKLLIGSFQP